jgi:ParB family chromosome partitioning protein
MRKALGRGLDALLPKTPAPSAAPTASATDVRTIPISAIRPNRLQPRKNFDPERLSELAQSIKEHGLAQPVVVSQDSATGGYELIAGERRLRASQLAGLTSIEAVVRAPSSDKSRLALALVENIQRDNLNAIETALSYKRLIDEFGMAQTQLSQNLGKSKSAISNTLRLLELSDDIQKAVQFEQISEGHARALLMVADPLQRNVLFRRTLEQALSVRAVEEMARKLAAGGKLNETPGDKPTRLKSADIRALEKHLEHSLGTKVEIQSRKDGKSGRIVLHFYSLTDFEKLLKVFKK